METKHFSNNPNINKIDLENGEILEVSLINTGEILGHGMWLNEQGLDSFMKCIEGTQVKAYYKHSEENEALSSIGYFENFQKKQNEDGEYQVVGDFSALNAWKESNNKEYSTFFELSEKAPEVFGISVEALIASWFYNEENELVMLEKEMPNEDTKIYAFCEKVLAWSVVSTPATNPNGLFSQEDLKEKTDMETQELKEKINLLETELETLVEFTTELKTENTTLTEDNAQLLETKIKLDAQVEELEAIVESLEIGSEPVVHNFAEEKINLTEQVKLEQDWGKKSKLVMQNLNHFQSVIR